MIPGFDDLGCLPPGVHQASLDEIDARFGTQSELRRVQMESVRWMVDLAARADVQRIVLNGSFVTDIIEPNDVDCVLLLAGGVKRDRSAVAELEQGLPFLDIALVRGVAFEEFIQRVFAADRSGAPKGMIEVVQWN